MKFKKGSVAHFNIKLVNCVKKHEIIYRFAADDHEIKAKTEAAWIEIAQYMDTPVPACQYKWKILRNSYIRSLRNTTAPNNKVKPYYLARYINFLLPYIARNFNIPLSPQLECSPQNETDSDPLTFKESKNANNIYVSDYKITKLEDSEGYSSVTRLQNSSATFSGGESEMDKDEDILMEQVNIPKRVDGQDLTDSETMADLHFLKSLLPDMAKLDSANKCKFKISVLSSLYECNSKNSKN